jgi:hypothetical protein
MKDVIGRSILVFATALLFTSLSASAAAECTKVEALGAVTELQKLIVNSSEFIGRGAQRAQDGLEAKAMTAGGKVEVNKYDDALQKLEEVVLKVDDLVGAPKPKLSENGANQISRAAMTAMDCVVQL